MTVPVKAAVGDSVISGCVNTSGTLKIRAEKLLEESKDMSQKDQKDFLKKHYYDLIPRHIIPDDMIAKAISLGVSKININTECQLVFAEATRKYIEEGKDQQGKGFDPRKLLAPGAAAIVDKCKEKIELFGCAGKG